MSILDKRANGVLMHISSLPGDTGIGTLGKHAYSFVDSLEASFQTYWQVLPIGPTSYGDSPYQSYSTFAGNPYFIDSELLVQDGYLSKEDYESINWGTNPSYVDYGLIYEGRQKLFEKLQKNFEKNIPDDYVKFCKENESWLNNYALFMAIKDAHNGVSFSTWEEDIRLRKPAAVKSWTKKCSSRIEYYKMLQYFFFKQWYALKDYANKHGVNIVGDIPIYVSADSADVWANPEQFALDEDLKPIEVAGCPPDYFSADGQLWGNPVYNWDFMKKEGYSWWKARLGMSLKNYDVLRIDHFRGFESYYCIPYGAKTAKEGVWRKGPGVDLFNEIKATYGDLPIIAEDLGLLTDSVRQLLADVGFPGMKILQFAFDSREGSEYLPLCYTKNSIVYTGTHDNDSIVGWINTISPEVKEYVKEYIRVTDDKDLPHGLMSTVMSSVSNTCILCIQDLLGLDGSSRMNKPSSVGENWRWRAREEQFTPDVWDFLGKNTVLYQRHK